NKLVSDFLLDHRPLAMHVSLHSMSFSEGALLLIERHWTDRTQRLREQFQEMVTRFGLRLHDHDRGGEKGFLYIGPGFSTTPEGQAMRHHFESLGDRETAALFHDSSMEFVRKIGGDPLCLVMEFPLFVIGRRSESPSGTPQAYLDLKSQIPDLRQRLLRQGEIEDTLREFQIRPLSLPSAIELQLRTIQLGLDTLIES
ncbi:peptidase M14, partial [bacterium]|nr:peptidase M14 [bacterium]